jgi:hypothetical protein
MTINTQDLLNNELVTLCSDPDTDPAVLCQLADELLQWNPWMRRRDPVGLMALAANPSVPIHKLMDLIRLKPPPARHPSKGLSRSLRGNPPRDHPKASHKTLDPCGSSSSSSQQSSVPARSPPELY